VERKKKIILKEDEKCSNPTEEGNKLGSEDGSMRHNARCKGFGMNIKNLENRPQKKGSGMGMSRFMGLPNKEP